MRQDVVMSPRFVELYVTENCFRLAGGEQALTPGAFALAGPRLATQAFPAPSGFVWHLRRAVCGLAHIVRRAFRRKDPGSVEGIHLDLVNSIRAQNGLQTMTREDLESNLNVIRAMAAAAQEFQAQCFGPIGEARH